MGVGAESGADSSPGGAGKKKSLKKAKSKANLGASGKRASKRGQNSKVEHFNNVLYGEHEDNS